MNGRPTDFDEASRVAAYASFGNGALLEVVLRWLPPDGSVLDVGCASGGLLAALEADAGRRVGVEVSAPAAAEARRHADAIVVGSILDHGLEVPHAPFDVVVCADVIEHVADPTEALEFAAARCRADGVVIVSVPNVAHWSSRARLLVGTWEYEETGIFDRTHLRFFTPTTARAALEQAGLAIVEEKPVVPALRNHVRALDRLHPVVARWVEQRWQRLAGRRPALFAFQTTLVGRPQRATNER